MIQVTVEMFNKEYEKIYRTISISKEEIEQYACNAAREENPDFQHIYAHKNSDIMIVAGGK